MNIWRKFEFRGRDRHQNPFVDFGFVEVEDGCLLLSSHMLREPLRVDRQKRVIPSFKRYYEAQGFSQLRYKVLWNEEGPVDTPSAQGWEDM
jgi:hypothetical protein